MPFCLWIVQVVLCRLKNLLPTLLRWSFNIFKFISSIPCYIFTIFSVLIDSNIDLSDEFILDNFIILHNISGYSINKLMIKKPVPEDHRFNWELCLNTQNETTCCIPLLFSHSKWLELTLWSHQKKYIAT